MSPSPTRVAARTLTLPRRGRLALVAAFAAAVAVVPSSQALASGHVAHTAATSALTASRGGHSAAPKPASRGGQHAPGGSQSAQIPPANPRSDHSWWPFANALHGSQVVESKDGGIQNLVFARGIVQAASDTSLTILSKDNVTTVWTLTADTKVRVRGHLVKASRLKAGQYVGTWGATPVATPSGTTSPTTGAAPTTASAPTARFVIIEWSPRPTPSADPAASPSASPSPDPSPSATGAA